MIQIPSITCISFIKICPNTTQHDVTNGIANDAAVKSAKMLLNFSPCCKHEIRLGIRDPTDSRYVIYDSTENIRSRFNINLSKTFDNAKKKTAWKLPIRSLIFLMDLRSASAEKKNEEIENCNVSEKIVKCFRILKIRNVIQNMFISSVRTCERFLFSDNEQANPVVSTSIFSLYSIRNTWGCKNLSEVS